MWKPIAVVIAGVPPGLLMHPMPKANVLALPGGPGTAKKIPKLPTDSTEEDIASLLIYRDDKGHMGIPGKWLYGSLSHAGKRIPYVHGGNARTRITGSGTGSYLYEFLELTSETKRDGDLFFPFLNLDEEGNIKWEPLVCRIPNPTTGAANCSIRPQFPEWSVRIGMKWNDIVPPDTIRQLFELAGSGSGLGSNRPNKGVGGPNGRFSVVKWEGLPEEKKVLKKAKITSDETVAETSGNGEAETKEVPGANRLAETTV